MVKPQQIENVLRDTIVRISEEYNVSCKETMIIIRTDNDGTCEPRYIADVLNGQVRRVLLFKDIYQNIISPIVEPKVRKILAEKIAEHARKKNVLPTAITIKVVTTKDDAEKIYYFIDVKHADNHKDEVRMKIDELFALSAA